MVDCPQLAAHALGGERTVGAYVHFPWCERRCPYCDFATRAEEREKIPQARYTHAVVREIEQRRERGQLERPLHSVFFGGGTPSLWDPKHLAEVLRGLGGASTVERTIECNPHALSPAAIDALAQAGLNRLSIGVQSLQNEQLRFLGRLHDRQRAIEAVRDAVTRFSRVSADLIFGMPGHDWEQLRADVDTLLDLGVEHISTYALTIEPGTQFGLRHKKGLLRVSSDTLYADLYERLQAHLEASGFMHYEVSNFAKPGAESVHNLGYWRGLAYLGIGAAAVGAIDDPQGRERTKNRVDASQYMEHAEKHGDLDQLAEERERLDATTRVREGLMLGLRTHEGVNVRMLSEQTGVDVATFFAETIESLCKQGRLVHENGRLRVPKTHWFRLDGIVLKFF